jgi:hypothetical protein
MDRRKFFSFLPAAPIGVFLAAEAMAKAPPASMAPDKALMTMAAHKPPPPPPPTPKYPDWGVTNIMGRSGDSLTVLDGGGGWVTNHIAVTQPSNVKFGSGLDIQADMQFDEETKVSMSVGKDGHLWLKINDEWKRIVTE